MHRREDALKEPVRKHEDRIHGVRSCFDRMLFRGHLPIMSGWSMAQLFKAHEIDSGSVKPFLLANAERVKSHALARQHGRPFEYLGSKLRKEDAARKIAERDNVDAGLVCVFSALKPCCTFSLRFTTGQPYADVLRCQGGHELPRLGRAKDLGSAAVGICLLPVVLVWAVVLWP